MRDRLDHTLKGLERRGQLRTLVPRRGVDLSSNDYLGLASSLELRQAVADALARGVEIGSGGSRLLRGQHEEHERLEAEASEFFGAESALYFGSGFIANSSIFSCLPTHGDLVVYDEWIHASAHDGMRAGKAETRAARHNDAEDFEAIVRRHRSSHARGDVFIAAETIYSMEGDRAPVRELTQVAARHDAVLILDEAHATGVFGRDGRGLQSEASGAALPDLDARSASVAGGARELVVLHTCGKALGVMGGLVLASREVRDYLVNRCRPFIYATAPSPLMAAAVRAALVLARRGSSRRERLFGLVERLGQRLVEKTSFRPSGTQIQPIVVGSGRAALDLSTAMQASGFDVRAIRPPTVPEGTARIRISLTLNVEAEDIDRAVDVLAIAARGGAS